MGRTYKRKEDAKPRIRVDPQILKEAVNKVLEGNTIKGTAKEYNVPIMTLKRYARKQKDQENEITYEPNYRQSQVFTKEEELHLAKYLEKASKLHHRVKRNFKRFTQKEKSSSEDDIALPPSPDSTYDMSEDENDDEYDVSSSCESEDDHGNDMSPETNDWVIVNLISMKNLVHRFVGQIQSVTDSGYFIKFAKKIDDSKFKWPIKDDVAAVARYQIVKKINPPKFKTNSKRDLI